MIKKCERYKENKIKWSGEGEGVGRERKELDGTDLAKISMWAKRRNRI